MLDFIPLQYYVLYVVVCLCYRPFHKKLCIHFANQMECTNEAYEWVYVDKMTSLVDMNGLMSVSEDKGEENFVLRGAVEVTKEEITLNHEGSRNPYLWVGQKLISWIRRFYSFVRRKYALSVDMWLKRARYFNKGDGELTIIWSDEEA